MLQDRRYALRQPAIGVAPVDLVSAVGTVLVLGFTAAFAGRLAAGRAASIQALKALRAK